MSDIITRLLLKTNEFDTNLNNAKQSVNSFQGGITSASKVAGAGIAKFAGAIGLALGSYEAFDKLIHSSQGTQDAFEWRMAACKESVDMFFHSLASGDFTAFNQGIENAYDNLIKLQQLRDDYADAKKSSDVFRSQYNYDSQRLKAVISDNNSTKGQKKSAADELKKITEAYSKQISQTNDINVSQMIQNAQTKTGRYFSKEDITRFFKVYNNPASSDDRKGNFDNYVERMNALKKKEYRTEYAQAGSGAGKMMVQRSVANPEVQKQIQQLQKENNELDRMYILSQHNDKTWEELSSSVIEYFGAQAESAQNLNFLVKQQNKVDKAKSGDGKSDADSPSGSLAYFDAEIAKKNKELINATDAQARAAIQVTINELEAKKLNLKIRVEKDVFETVHGEMKGGELKLPNTRGIEALNEMSVNRAVIGWYEQTIAQKETELSKATDAETKSFIQSEINKLKGVLSEFNKLQENGGLKIGSAYSAFRNNSSTKKDKDGNIIETDFRKQTKGMKLPKVKSPVSKKDIKLNEEYNDTLNAMCSIMGSLSGAFDQNTASALQWGATLLTTIGQTVSAIQSAIPAKKASAAASKEEATAEIIDGSAKTINAHASIPFAGIAIGLAGVASIIAMMSSMPKFATGGVVPGVSFTGDKVPAWLNSGEMILNGGQQANLFRMLNAGLNAGITAEQVQPNMGNVSRFIMPDESAREIVISGTLRANGSVLETVLNNYTHKKSKVR